MTLIIRCNERYLPERRYIFDVVLGDCLGLEYELVPHNLDELHILLQHDTCGRVLRVADSFFQTPKEDWLTEAAMPQSPLDYCELPEEWINERSVSPLVPVMFGEPTGDRGFLTRSDDNVCIGIDIFGSAFFMLTRYEEVIHRHRDRHGRFSAAQSLAMRDDLLERPLVNEYVEILWQGLLFLYPQLVRKARQYRALMSHDLDLPLMHTPEDTWRGVLRCSLEEDILGRRNVGMAARRLRSYHSFRRGRVSDDPYNTHSYLMDISESHGIRSAFYFMTGATHPVYDPNRSTDDPFIHDLIRSIHQRGHEIGFHPSYCTSVDADRTKVEFDSFRRLLETNGIELDEYGGRQHFLRWENPQTWRNWQHIGAAYDSTLGFADRVGFRCGMCYEYPVFDLQAREATELRERPLVASDSALLNYMKLELTEALSKIQALSETCARFDGDFSLLVHNSTLHSKRRRRWYADVVKAVA